MKYKWFDFGDNYLEKGACYKTYGISRMTDEKDQGHANQIEVYGDEDLRDYILELLKKYPYITD